jgi:hypothetical protein
MTEAPSQQRLQTVERRFHRAVREGDHAALEVLLSADFTASELRGETGIPRREFLRRVIYAEITAPPSEPQWAEADEATPPGVVSYNWTDDEGDRSLRASFWISAEEGLRLHQHLAVERALNGMEIRK